MKKIEAIVRHHTLDSIRDALTNLGIFGMTVSEVRGYGRQKGHTESYRGAEYKIDFVPKVKLEIVCSEENLTPITDVLINAARSGNVGDGKIFISELSDVIRIRTGERGKDAV